MRVYVQRASVETAVIAAIQPTSPRNDAVSSGTVI